MLTQYMENRKAVLEFIKDNLYNFPIFDIVSTRKVYNPRAKTQHENGGGVGVGREESFKCGIYHAFEERRIVIRMGIFYQ